MFSNRSGLERLLCDPIFRVLADLSSAVELHFWARGVPGYAPHLLFEGCLTEQDPGLGAPVARGPGGGSERPRSDQAQRAHLSQVEERAQHASDIGDEGCSAKPREVPTSLFFSR